MEILSRRPGRLLKRVSFLSFKGWKSCILSSTMNVFGTIFKRKRKLDDKIKRCPLVARSFPYSNLIQLEKNLWL